MRRLRPVGPPADVVRASGLPSGERVLAAADDEGGHWLLGTRAHLAVVGQGCQSVVLPWDEIRAADWDEAGRRLRIREVGRWGRPPSSYDVTFARTPVSLLQLIRERVTASIVLSRRVLLAGGRGATVTGRRNPDGGEVRWLVDYDAGVDPEDPHVSGRVDAAVAELAAEV